MGRRGGPLSLAAREDPPLSSVAVVLAVGLLLTGASCRCRAPSPSRPGAAPPASASAVLTTVRSDLRPTSKQELSWDYPQTELGPMRVVVSVPGRPSMTERFPVLVAMHGRGEALKGPERGARGWIDDYRLESSLARLGAPPLTRRDFLGMVTEDRLALLNRALDRRAFGGLIVVCPYTPDRLRGRDAYEHALPLATFLVDEVLPRVYRETPALGTPASTGIDGVSLGGRASLLVGLRRPEAFAAVGALQPAFDEAEATELALRARQVSASFPRLKFRFLTSTQDYYLEATRRLATEFAHAAVEAELLIVAGDHSYEFNRGPGGIEMLLFHDRVLRGAPSLEATSR